MNVSNYYLIAVIPILFCISNYIIANLFVSGIKNKCKSTSYCYLVKIVAIVGSILLWLTEYSVFSEMIRQVNISTYSPSIFIILGESSLIFSLLLFAVFLYSLLFKSDSWRDCIKRYRYIVCTSYIGWGVSFLALLILYLYF